MIQHSDARTIKGDFALCAAFVFFVVMLKEFAERVRDKCRLADAAAAFDYRRFQKNAKPKGKRKIIDDILQAIKVNPSRRPFQFCC